VTLGFSHRAARTAGLLIPLLETCRRWHQLTQPARWPSIFDDYLMGLLLLLAAFQARRDPVEGRTWLAAAWGLATGMMFGSFFGQLVALGEPDPSGIPARAVVAFKGVFFAVCVAGLVGALRQPPPRERPGAPLRPQR
jgi:hypothetical protein